LAFTPSLQPLVSSTRSVTSTPAIRMAGWNDPYAKGAGRKVEKLELGKTKFEQEMESSGNSSNKYVLYATVAMVVGCFGLLLAVAP